MTTIKSLDEVKVQEISKNSSTAEAVMMTLALRQRNRNEIKLDGFKNFLLKEGFEVVEKDFVDSFKKLEEAGAGSFIYGRKGNENRFKWNFSIKDIGNLAFPNKEEAEKHLKEVVVAMPKKKRGRPAGTKAKVVKSALVTKRETPKTFIISLHSGKTLSLNLTNEEATSLANALQQASKV